MSALEAGSVIRIEKEFNAVDWTSFPILSQWDRALQLLHHLCSLDCAKADQFRVISSAIKCLQSGVQFDTLLSLWKEVLNANSTSPSRSFDDHGLINAFRLFSNAFVEHVPHWGVQNNYTPLVMKALVHCIGMGSYSPPNLSSMVSSFSEPNLGYFCEEIVSYKEINTLTANIAQATDPILGLNIARIVLKHAAVVICNEGDSNRLTTCKCTAMHFITGAHMRKVPTNEILDTIALNSRIRSIPIAYIPLVSRTLAYAVVAALPKGEMPMIWETVGNVWGDKSFVASADAWKQAYYTQILLEALLRGEINQLYTKGLSGVSADFLLSMGISHYLDVDNISIRKHGMRVAEAYATLMGEPLSFDELKAVTEQEESALTEARRRHSSSNSTHREVTKQAQHSELKMKRDEFTQINHNVESEDDSDDELQGFALDDEGVNSKKVFDYKDKLLRTNYLRDCLAMLRCPEDKPEARQQLEAALERIPLIMASNPPDSADLCEPLVKELLTVSDAFSIADFENLRATAVQSVLQAHPDIAVPFLTSQLLGNDLPLGVKLIVLEWLMTAAKILSNIDTDDTKSPATGRSNPPLSSPAESTTSSSDAVKGGKTTIKRPGKLAQLEARVKYFRNNFGPLSGQFFYPIIQLLGKIWNNSLNEVTPPLSADKFNLISELFENGGKKSGSTAGKGGITPDAALSHLDGSDVLLPSQCLVALGLFTRCAINTTHQREHALNVARVASLFRLASAVALRRASLYALRLSFEAYIHTSGPGNATRARLPNSPMDELCNISSVSDGGMLTNADGTEQGDAGDDSAASAILSQPALVEVVDWAAKTWKDDADEVARALKREIVAIAVNGMKP